MELAKDVLFEWHVEGELAAVGLDMWWWWHGCGKERRE